MKKANLKSADLKDAYLVAAKGLTPNQVKSAKNWQEAEYDVILRRKLGLPPVQQKNPRLGLNIMFVPRNNFL